VTGFGPFDVHTTNPSWSAVKRLPECLRVSVGSAGIAVAIVKLEIPVSYKSADELYSGDVFPRNVGMGRKQDPLAILHVGVNGTTDSVELERFAFNRAVTYDVERFCPENQVVHSDDPPEHRIGTQLNLDGVIDAVRVGCSNDDDFAPAICVSTDAGRYLCNYVYYKACKWASRKINDCTGHSGQVASAPGRGPGRVDNGSTNVVSTTACLFVHVPVERRPHSVEQLACILTHITAAIAEQQLDSHAHAG
jgi:pyrrolidone-carboxylate peptidase